MLSNKTPHLVFHSILFLQFFKGDIIMYRRKTFDDKLSKKLKKANYSKTYILDAIKKGKTVMEALKDTISCMGTKEFSEVSGIKSPNISRMLSQDAIPKLATLQKFLDPFSIGSLI